MSANTSHSVIRPLRFIFWGALICILDFAVSIQQGDTGFRFDILNDTIGMLMIAWGVRKLASIQLHDRFTKAMQFTQAVAILAVLDTLPTYIIIQYPPVVTFAFSIFSIISLVAIVIFCRSMQWLSEATDLEEAEQSWRTTTRLFISIYLIPLGMIEVVSVFTLFGTHPIHIDLGPLALLFIPISIVPVIHFFLSTSRMIQQTSSQTAEPQ